MRLCDDALIPQYRRLVDLIHREDCPVLAQLALGAYYRPVGNGKFMQVEPDDIPMFPFLDVMLQYWDSDDEFPASLQLFVDDKIIDFMHCETVWFVLSHMLERIKELMQE